MKLYRAVLIAGLLLTAFAEAARAAKLERAVMTASEPPPCSIAWYQPPAPATAFLTTDTEAWLWFAVSDAKVGDEAISEYYTPAGQFYGATSGPWELLKTAGNVCFTDVSFRIKGQLPATLPGNWKVRVTYNAAVLFELTFTVAAPGGGGGTGGGSSVTVDAKANIFAAGRSTAFNGILPPVHSLPAAAGKALTFPQVTGTMTCTGGSASAGPDGGACAGGVTDINSYQGISGIKHGSKTQFLVGVFLGTAEPREPAPARLDFTGNDNFTVLRPEIGQTFFVGDGKSNTGIGGTGPLQQFVVPAGATRLFLGIADAYAFHGNPGTYDDNSGSFSATVQVVDAPQGGGGTACNYFVNPLAQAIPGTGGTGLVLVNTAAGCQWTATSNVTWIAIDAGASGSGGGAVSYTVAANPASSPRTGTLTIAGQTHTVTQAAGGTPSCSYTVTPLTASLPASGGEASVLVAAGSGCAWTARANDGWLSIVSGASGSGGGTVRFSATANSAASARAGTLTVAGQSVTVTQAAGASGGGPQIKEGGVVNAASFVSADYPTGGIARGSFFTVFGTAIGPAQYAQAGEYPLGKTLAGVSVRISRGSIAVDALPVFVSETQMNGIMPSSAPLGDAQITITYNGRTSAPMPVKVMENNFGIFTTAGGRGPAIFQNYMTAADQPLNTPNNCAKPLQVGTLWGTGLGALPGGGDQLAPPAGDLPVAVEVYVGGKVAKKLYSGRAPCCAGVDQIVFEVPSDAPQGCYVPVQVKAGASFSNIATIAVNPSGGRCSNEDNPFGSLTAQGGKTGTIALVRAGVNATVEGGDPIDMTLDFGLGMFTESEARGELGYHPLYSLPPVGACSVFTGSLDLSSVLGSALGGSVPGDSTSRELDAGREITVSGAKGTIPLVHLKEEEQTGPYLGLLGGKIPIGDDPPSLPLFLDAGSFTVRGTGGRDVGPFTATFTLPEPVTWTNRNQITSVTRSSGLTLNWTGGDPTRQTILIAGASSDQKSKASAGFYCLAPVAARTFTVPPNILMNLPANTANSLEDSIGGLAFGTVPSGASMPKFTAPGLDGGMIVFATGNIKTLQFK